MAGNNVRYESNAQVVKKTIVALEKKGLRAVAKIARPAVKRKVPVDDGVLKKNVGSWVKGRAREKPTLQIGVYTRDRARRKGYTYAYHAHLVQFGTRKMRATDYLRAPIYDLLSRIEQTIGEYLSQIESIKENGVPIEEDEVSDD